MQKTFMKIKNLIFNIGFKNKIKDIKNIFESYLYSYIVLNKNLDLSRFEKESLESIIINDTYELRKIYKIIPNIGDNFFKNIFFGLIKLDEESILIFFESNKKIQINHLNINELKKFN